MTQAIILAADGSEHSDRALQWYCDYLHTKDHVLYIVTSSEIPNYMAKNKPLFDEDKRKWEQMLSECRDKATRVLDKYVEICKDKNINFVACAEDGSPGDTILRKAAEVKASYIVIGSRGCGAIHNVILGSCSDHVVHHAHHANTAVVVVPPPVSDKKHDHKGHGSKKDKQDKEKKK